MSELTIIEWTVTIIVTLFLMRGVIAFIGNDLKIGEGNKVHKIPINTNPFDIFELKCLTRFRECKDKYTNYEVTYEAYPLYQIHFEDKKTGFKVYVNADQSQSTVEKALAMLRRGK